MSCQYTQISQNYSFLEATSQSCLSLSHALSCNTAKVKSSKSAPTLTLPLSLDLFFPLSRRAWTILLAKITRQLIILNTKMIILLNSELQNQSIAKITTPRQGAKATPVETPGLFRPLAGARGPRLRRSKGRSPPSS